MALLFVPLTPHPCWDIRWVYVAREQGVSCGIVDSTRPHKPFRCRLLLHSNFASEPSLSPCLPLTIHSSTSAHHRPDPLASLLLLVRQDFKERLKTMYDMLFTRCMLSGVTHPGFLPIGLGVFLPRIQSSDVKTLYHEAQFELLSGMPPTVGRGAEVGHRERLSKQAG